MDSSTSLVLSGGAALGFSHVGVLKMLKDKNIHLGEIIGTSMGAIVASLYSMKFSESKNDKYIKKISDIFNWVNYSYWSVSIIDTKKIIKLLDEVFGNTLISETKIPLKIIATDFTSGKARCFNKDDSITIKEAVLASMAIPGVFPFQTINGVQYVDGYLSANLPVQFVDNDMKNIIASNVVNLKSAPCINDKSFSLFPKTSFLLNSQERSFRILISNQTDEYIKRIKNKNLILIEPLLKDYKTFHFGKVEDLISIGYKEAVKYF